MTKYVLVQWPESQYLMEHERFNECLLVQDIEGHDEVGGSAYMCPEDLHEEIFNEVKKNDTLIINALKSLTLNEVIKLVNKALDREK